ncbi:MAG: glycosyltransferase family protein [Candidatus Woesearchaeota archaeon]
MKILFAVNSIGLGHATRCYPLIKEAINKGHEVFILSNYRALDFLKNEFKEKAVYFKLPDYSFQKKIFTEKKVSMANFIMYLPLYIKEFRDEHKNFLKIHREYKFDKIISDSRFGIYCEKPSYLISHHIKISLNGFLKNTDKITEFVFYALKNKFRKILIPDFEKNSLAGDYTHNFNYLRKKDYSYIGLLSMLKKENINQDIDYFFSISGPEPQRTVFEKFILKNIKKIKKKKVIITLGKPESSIYKKISSNKSEIEIFGFLDREKQENIMNRAKLIITRSGYTTIMDLAELEKKALLIPTKGQPEQEYLAKYHLKEGNFYYKDLENLNLEKDLEIAEKFSGFIAKKKTKDSVKNFLKEINLN